jgi:hypothetical protein
MCERVLGALGLPKGAANPLLAKTFASHVKAVSQAELFRA